MTAKRHMIVERLASRVQEHLEAKNQSSNSHHPWVPGLTLLSESNPTQFEAMIYEPVVCLILQGEKETTVAEHSVTIAEGQCIVVSHDLPVLARITKASPRRPYLSMVIQLDLGVLRSLYDEVGEAHEAAEGARSIEVGVVDEPTLRVIERYFALLDDPVEARVLLPLVTKELHFRLHQSNLGGMLRSLLRRDSNESNVARAIQTLRREFRSPLDVSSLAKSVGMSVSSFHKHFKLVTMTTPLQYQKDLRLTEARRLLRSGQATVSSAAFDVGYESASQFTREYGRKFGAPPRLDLRVA
jgi:AraC-like DNA-binding protein